MTEYRYKRLSPDANPDAWRVRIKGFTFAYFTICMATGGLADVLYRIPPRYACQGTLNFGKVVLIWDIVLLLFFIACMVTRFTIDPRAILSVFLHPSESSYICAFAQAISVLLLNIIDYGFSETGPWLKQTVLVLFYIQGVFILSLSILLPLVQWDSRDYNLDDMPPSWLLLPTLSTYIGNLGANLSTELSFTQGVYVFWSAYFIFGIGFFLAIFYFALWIVRQAKGGLFKDSYILSPFMMVGTAAYAASGYLAFGHASDVVFGPQADLNGLSAYGIPGDSLTAIATFRIVHLSIGMLWFGLAWWSFLLSIAMTFAVLVRHGRQAFKPGIGGVWSLQFPTTGLIVATWDVARNLSLSDTKNGPRWIDGLGVALLFVWVIGYSIAVALTILFIYQRKFLWPAKDDNKPVLGYEGEFEPVSETPKMTEIRANGSFFGKRRFYTMHDHEIQANGSTA